MMKMMMMTIIIDDVKERMMPTVMIGKITVMMMMTIYGYDAMLRPSEEPRRQQASVRPHVSASIGMRILEDHLW